MQIKYPAAVVFAFLLFGCGESEEAKIRLTISPSTSIQTGQQLILDAAESTFDTISWELDGLLYGPCMTEAVCILTFNRSGNYTMRIEVNNDHRPDWTGLMSQAKSHDEVQVKLTVSDNRTQSDMSAPEG